MKCFALLPTKHIFETTYRTQMEANKILELLSYTIPAIVTGLVAMYFFKQQSANDQQKRLFQLKKENQSIALPLRLQAYERLTIFLERISPNKLLLRVKPSGKDKALYGEQLIAIIEQELDHNLAQQIYVSETAWKAVVTAKNVMIKVIRTAMENEQLTDVGSFQEEILKSSIKKESPTAVAISFLRSEAQKLF